MELFFDILREKLYTIMPLTKKLMWTTIVFNILNSRITAI